MNTEQKDQLQEFQQAEPVDGVKPEDDNDFPLGKACDLSGEGTCEACQ